MKLHHGLILAWALCAAAAATGARAQDADAADLRCFVIALNIAANADDNQKPAGMMAAAYYMGRLDGRTPNLDIKALVTDQIQKMTPDDMRAAAPGCADTLMVKGKAMEAFAELLSAPAQPSAPAKPPN